MIDVQHDLEEPDLMTITADFAAPVALLSGRSTPTPPAGEGCGTADLPGHRRRPQPDPGGRVTYFMTGPGRRQARRLLGDHRVDEPTSFSFLDGFADLDFNPNPDLPVSQNTYSFAEHDGGTRARST